MTMTRRVPNLGYVLKATLLYATISISRVHGQSVALYVNFVPYSNFVYEAYFGDGQSTTAIGDRLPLCQGSPGAANQSLKLENTVINQVIQQTALMGSVGLVTWNTAQFPTLLSTLTGRYVCTIFSSSVMVTHPNSYQLNVVAPCDPFTNSALDSTPTAAMNYKSTFSVGCAKNYTIPQGSLNITSLTCQANGAWSTLPNCVEDLCRSSPCMSPFSSCNLTSDGTAMCPCPSGTTGTGFRVDGCVTVCSDHCDDKNAVCLENGGIRSCRCKAGYTGSTQTANSCVNINECLLSPCQDCWATCVDTEGSFQCLCPSDFQGNGLERGGCSRGSGSALSTGVIAGTSCGAFFLGSIIASLITWYLTRREYGGNPSANSRDARVEKPPVGMAMTNSDAYGMVDVPSTQQQQPQYDYILPEAQ